MKYLIEITTSKEIQVEAESEEKAKQMVSQMSLEVGDFDWDFLVEEQSVREE